MSFDADMFNSMSDDVLESEIRGLSARVAAAMCRFLTAVAEYDRRRAWEAWECRDMAGWLAWKCGISLVTAREYCRVAQALAAEDQERARRTGRYLRFGYDDEGCLVGSFRVPAEAGALLAGALEAVVDRDAVDDAAEDGAREPFLAVQADALVELVAAGHKALTDGSDDEEDSRFLLTVVAERHVLEGKEDAGPGGECRVDDGPGLSAETARRIGCDCTVAGITEGPDGSVLDVGRRTRLIGRRMRRALRRRDSHCRYPGCTRRVVEGHHIRHWAQGGPTKLDNLISLCGRHHHRLHEGGYRIRRDRTGRVEFVRPDGWVVPEVCPPAAPSDSRLDRDEPDPYQDGWDGSPLHLGIVVESLVLADQGRDDQPAATDHSASVATRFRGIGCR